MSLPRFPTVRTCGVLLTLLATALPLAAADTVFPPASRVGLTPPEGFVPSANFNGFENADKTAAILISELPSPAYAEIDKAMTPEAMKGQGVDLQGREPITLKSGPAFLAFGRQDREGIASYKWVLVASSSDLTAVVAFQVLDAAKDKFPEATVRAVLASTILRDKVPEAELLGVLPYNVTDLSHFRIVRVLPGNAAMLTEGPKDAIEFPEQPLFLISTGPGAPTEAAERATFARRAFGSLPGLKDIRLTRAEPLRINGQPGFEILAEAKDEKTDTDITIVQWLRFGGGGHLRLLGVARKDAWDKFYPRFRAVRDGIEARS